MKNISRIKDQTSTKNDVNDKYEFQKKRKENYLLLFPTDLKKITKQTGEKKIKESFKNRHE